MSRRSLIRDARLFETGWRVWFWALLIVNILGPLVFIDHLEAKLTLLAYVLAAAVIVPMHRRLGWVRLLGIGHFVWLPLLPWLVVRYLQTAPAGAFGAWVLAVIAIDGACLVIDVVDITRYVAGDRRPIVPR